MWTLRKELRMLCFQPAFMLCKPILGNDEIFPRIKKGNVFCLTSHYAKCLVDNAPRSHLKSASDIGLYD